jgi:general secretion pathway protein K
MKILPRRAPRGIALLIVMITVFILTALVGAFTYQMKIETKLARNDSYETELEWIGRSGVEYCRWILAQQLNCPMPYDALNQTWAAGQPMGDCATNGPLAAVLTEVHLGGGSFTWKITDGERKFNINALVRSPEVLDQAFSMMGVDAGEYPQIVASIQDWIDPAKDPRIGGAESDYYQGLTPPYNAKNGPIDDLSELLLVKGVTPEMYDGSMATNAPSNSKEPVYPVHLKDLFTTLSDGKININTASASTLELIPGVDPTVADCILKQRAGPDGVDGTDDDVPFHNPGELVNCVPPALMSRLQQLCDVRSHTFEVEITAQIGGYQRKYYAVIGRNTPQDIQVLTFHAE